jgi:MmyB-like transcription regulator ligand binding domain/Helix-turn-helix domain
VSVDWYVRLEQDRAERPSTAVLDAVARALELSGAERRYLFRLARGEEPTSALAGEALHPSLGAALKVIVDRPALALGPRFDVLETNPLGEALFGGFGDGPFGKNAAWFTLADARARTLFSDFRKVARETVGTLRAGFARRPLDASFLALIAGLSARSPLFVELWGEQHVHEKGLGQKRFQHPSAGRLDLVVHTLAAPEAEGQLLVFYEPNDAKTRLRLPKLLTKPARRN